MSRTDQLTGLLNRRGYLEAATGVLAKAKAAKSSAVALMCDIDRFKAINDQFGHDFGDKVLIEIGETIRAFGDEHGTLVARHGGEEFVAPACQRATSDMCGNQNNCGARSIGLGNDQHRPCGLG
jgi:diguanylate cyclase (GGDEF)-like protein